MDRVCYVVVEPVERQNEADNDERLGSRYSRGTER